MNDAVPIRFAAIGLDHAHIFGQTRGLLAAGAELVGVATRDERSGIAQTFHENAPDVPTRSEAELLADPDIDVIVTAAIPKDRAEIALAALRVGKDVMTDKPGCTTMAQLEELRATVAETGRIWSVTYSERFEVPAVARAGEIARSGRIGQVVQTLGLGPHREGDRAHLGASGGRPDWFYDEANFGGILVDIASHQFDQFLWFTNSTTAEVASSTVANYAHPDDPAFQDFGDVVLRNDHATGYVRVDWFTPEGLPTWGDGRLFILGTQGYIELRKYVDIAGREGTNHLFVADADGVHHESCDDLPVTYYRQFLDDVRDRTETACPQEHTFEVMRLALQAQADAVRQGHLA
ncbi:Gfo/Idh/MocA family oxidoreductase [Propioniciclava soli]|uniref:Gfo/Idh/MocA family oxidoreductase n=1 Tax=Propioniciclava soli TaxID=2775081 RepID=A0ABZ3C4J5_9ACTN